MLCQVGNGGAGGARGRLVQSPDGEGERARVVLN